MSRRALVILTAAMIAAAAIRPATTATTARVAAVLDGDTIILAGGERLRYLGIDAPEKDQCFGPEATAANRALVLGKQVRLVADRRYRDDYGRRLRHVYVGGKHVNLELVRGGYARRLAIPPNTALAPTMRRAERSARLRGLGLWAVCGRRP